MKLNDIGEFGLIELLKRTEKRHRPDVVIGIGDDAAVLKTTRPHDRRASKIYQLITTDTFIENIHFKLKKGRDRFFALGQKALAANISDILAMGGCPTHALVTIGLPGRVTVEQVERLYKGIDSLAKEHGIDIIGGDTISSPKEVLVSITLMGEVEKEYLLTRSGARPGDLLCVTGRFGGPAYENYGLRITDYALRFKEARVLSRSGIVTSMIDSSDGLVRSVIELCKRSGTGAVIFKDKVPAAAGATLDQALYGGEEYELVFTVPKSRLMKLKVKASVVGEMAAKEKGIKLADKYGKIRPLKSGGYEHFAKRKSK
ncbi:MAG TPA: thiamine-phosphate kinase [Candidatus Omnitrophota bacterium]|nr:thiamine-phosphate kinase [Candidatus Omnitrophota bacterium]